MQWEPKFSSWSQYLNILTTQLFLSGDLSRSGSYHKNIMFVIRYLFVKSLCYKEITENQRKYFIVWLLFQNDFKYY